LITTEEDEQLGKNERRWSFMPTPWITTVFPAFTSGPSQIPPGPVESDSVNQIRLVFVEDGSEWRKVGFVKSFERSVAVWKSILIAEVDNVSPL
jgi:hypothetical protein